MADFEFIDDEEPTEELGFEFTDDGEPTPSKPSKLPGLLKTAATGIVPGGPAIAALGIPQVQQFLTETPALPIAGGIAFEAASLPLALTATAVAGPAAGLGIRSLASGIGEAGGEAFRQIGQQALGAPSAPQTSGEAAQRIGGSFAIGAATPPLGAGAARVLGAAGRQVRRAGETLRPALTEAAGSTRRIITRFGGKLTLGQLTENKFIDLLDNIARGSLTGGGILAQTVKATEKAVTKLKDVVLKRLGKESSKFLTEEELGQVLSNHIESGRVAFKAVSGKLYNTVDNEIGQAIVNPTKLVQELGRIQQEGLKRVSNPIVQAVTRDIQKIVTNSQNNLTFETATSLRSSLLERARDLGDTVGAGEAKRVLNGLAASLGDSIDDAGRILNPKAQKLWRVANKFFKENITTFENDFVEKLVSTSKDVTRLGQIFTDLGNPKQIQAVLNAVKRASLVNKDLPFSKAMQQIRQGFLDNAFGKATNPATGQVDFNKLLTAFKPNERVGEISKQIFNPLQLKRLDRLLQTGSQALTAPGGGTGAFGLAQLGAAVGLPAALATGATKAASLSLGVLLAPRFIARAVTSDTITNLAVKGFNVAVKEGTESASFKFIARLAGEAAKE